MSKKLLGLSPWVYSFWRLFLVCFTCLSHSSNRLSVTWIQALESTCLKSDLHMCCSTCTYSYTCTNYMILCVCVCVMLASLYVCLYVYTCMCVSVCIVTEAWSCCKVLFWIILFVYLGGVSCWTQSLPVPASIFIEFLYTCLLRAAILDGYHTW